jgi:hypothetical protein
LKNVPVQLSLAAVIVLALKTDVGYRWRFSEVLVEVVGVVDG